MKLMKFKRVAVTVLIVLAAYLLQCTLFNHLELAGIKPNLILIVTASFGFMRGQKEGMLVGFFAERVIDGVSGGWEQFFIQLLGVAVVAVYSFVVTWILMMVLHKPRVSPEQEREGLDKSEFGEEAYYFDKN